MRKNSATTKEKNKHSAENLLMYVQGMCGSNKAQRNPLQKVAKAAGVSENVLRNFIDSPFMRKHHAEEREICLGVIKFYEKWGDKAATTVNLYADDEKTLLEKIQMIVDFLVMAKAKTRHVTYYFGVTHVAKFDYHARKLLAMYDKERFEQFNAVRASNHRVRAGKYSKGFMRWFSNGLMSDEEVAKLCNTTEVETFAAMEIGPYRASELLADGRTLIFGNILHDNDEVVVVDSFAGDVQALRKMIDKEVKPLYRKDARRASYLECIMRPYYGKDDEMAAESNKEGRSKEDESTGADIDGEEIGIDPADCAYIVYVRQYADEPVDEPVKNDVVKSVVAQYENNPTVENGASLWDEDGNFIGNDEVAKALTQESESLFSAYIEGLSHRMGIVPGQTYQAAFVYPVGQEPEGVSQSDYSLLTKAVYTYLSNEQVKYMYVNGITCYIEDLLGIQSGHKVSLETYKGAGPMYGKPKLYTSQGSAWFNIVIELFEPNPTDGMLVSEGEVVIGSIGVRLDGQTGSAATVTNLWFIGQIEAALILKGARFIQQAGPLGDRLNADGLLRNFVGHQLIFMDGIEPLVRGI